MRTGGGFTVQQALTAEAATMVKQAVSLARRRGHAQVTPLHVANTMLASSTGLLRTACLQSHSHPLQCKALELCFNVALNRLPAASSASPMLGPHTQHPSISNALVAAFKRAQAHQRRGSIENQQQPLLAVKIELEQLIISILDDPSVSRVMREAGFSSTQVKSNVEQAVSLEICSQTPQVSNSSKSKERNQIQVLNDQVRLKSSKSKVSSNIHVSDEDVESVIENFMNKRKRSTVVVGECLASIEGVVKAVMDKFHKGDVPEGLKDVRFINLPLFAFDHLSREDVEHKLGELRCHIKSFVNQGVVLFLGDLKWTIESRASSGFYCPVEHVIVELGRLVCGINGENGRFWLMGIAIFQTYMRCRREHPSFETLWGLQPLTIPAGSLGLSLIPDSDSQSESRSKKSGDGSSWLLLDCGDEKQLSCCSDCSAKFETEARSLQSNCNADSTTSTLPSWLQQYKNENKRLLNNDQDNVPLKDLYKKWNSFCSSAHKQKYTSEKTLSFSSASPSSSTSGFSFDHQYPNFDQTHQSWRDHHFWISEAVDKALEPSLRMHNSLDQNNKPKHAYPSSPNSTPNSASSSDVMETEYIQRFKELNAENLKNLCNALEQKVPWQKDIIPDIATTILQCRSGMLRRKGNNAKNNEPKEETWLFFQGVDMEAKEKIARALARLVFGSHKSFISIALSSFSSTRADSTEDIRNKRSRDEQSCSYFERFAEAVSTNPHRVFLVEDVEQADYCSQMGIKRAIERGKISNTTGEDVGLGDSIIILSCESFSSRSRACSPPIKQKLEKNQQGEEEEEKYDDAAEEETSLRVPLDLNISVDDGCVHEQSIDDIGLLDSVDRRIIFKIQEL
ncbi:Clp, repeat (R) domain [Dillenia turbinata]|uniref:Clp, repeat (R) domain n=1 Tax=Dillenia turbinata TaxID=194707 RepID=A0AAN8W6G5_9MAGN